MKIGVWAVSPFSKTVVKGTLEDLNKHLYTSALKNIDLTDLKDKFVIVKGCSKVNIPETAYVDLFALLNPVVKTLRYGEACSKVPLNKRR